MGDGRGVDMCGGDAIRGAEGGDFRGADGANEDVSGMLDLKFQIYT